MSSKLAPYSLYQTFNGGKLPKIPLKKNQKTKIIDTIPNLSHNEQIALSRLIIEHYKISNDIDPTKLQNELSDALCSNLYDSKLIDGKRIFTVDKFPLELQWIVIKFIDVCEGQ